MKQIEVIISPEGGTTVKTTGFTGKSCKDATARIERDLGIVTSDRATPEAANVNTPQLNTVRQ